MDKILLVNDSATLTKVLKSHFRNAGYEVLGVDNAMDAYQQFIRNEVQLILTDFLLKDHDGLALIRTFRANKGHDQLPIVVFTASEDEEVVASCKEAGADLVLSKTSDTSGLLDSIEKMVEEYKSRLPSNSIDVDMGNSMVKATAEVFRTMMDCKLTPGEIAVEKVKDRSAEVIGSLGVAGFLSGSISVFMPKAVAETSARKLLMMEPEDEMCDEELVDAVGELTNMIGGNIKTELFKKTPLFDISVPSVFMGEDLRRRTVSDDLCFHVPFTLPSGETFSVEFLMITKQGNAGTTGVQDALVASMTPTEG